MNQAVSAPRLSQVTPSAVVSVQEVVTRILREAILQGKLAQGERLVQDDLAAELGVSRQPVREAMRRLESEGLIVRMPGRGYVVREYTEEDARENYHLRGLMESEAAWLAAQRIQPHELEALRAINRAMAEAASGLAGTAYGTGDAVPGMIKPAPGLGGSRPGNNAWALVDLNARFHQKVHECSRMPGLASLISRLWVGLTVLTPLLTPGRPLQSVAEHERLIEALAARDPEAAAAAMREHIEAGARAYFSAGLGRTAEMKQQVLP